MMQHRWPGASWRSDGSDTPSACLRGLRKSRTPEYGSRCESLRSHVSKGWITNFSDPRGLRKGRTPEYGSCCESLRSHVSKGWITNFSDPRKGRTPGYEPSFVSLRSHISKGWNTNFSHLRSSDHPRLQSTSVSTTSSFRENPTGYEDEPLRRNPDVPLDQEPQNDLNNIFKQLEQEIVTFVQDELRRFHRVLSPDHTDCFLSEEGEEQRSRKAFMKIALDFLRRKMKQEELADNLQRRTDFGVCRHKLMEHMKHKFRSIPENVDTTTFPTSPTQGYTDLCITEGGAAGVNEEHEVVLIEMASKKPITPETTIVHEHIFKHSANKQSGKKLASEQRPVRTVLTKGVAGIGKTVLTQKFCLDWAEGKTNQDIQMLFPFSFRELNVLRDSQFSLVGLLHHFFKETAPLCSFEDVRVVFIFDGLDEYRLPLDFTNTQVLNDATESGSVSELIVNLIRGNLLPSALLWITTRPAAASQIPDECVSRVTEVRGFTNEQKEEYFRNNFKEEQQALDITSYIKNIRTLYIMCHIPIFCWIICTVLNHLMRTSSRDSLPQNLTQMYIHFLNVQIKNTKLKYDETFAQGPIWSTETIDMVKSLGKLAFEQLRKGNLIFYESDLTECGLDAAEIRRYSGVFTQVFREEPGMYQGKVYCFIHLSVQEFLAALHVHQTFFSSGINAFVECQAKPDKAAEKLLYQYAVDEALKSPNGHLDLFLRFLLGLSLPSNQKLLQGFLSQSTSHSKTIQKTTNYIQYRIDESLSAERSINLFHCLNELEADNLVKQMQQVMRRGPLSEYMSPAQWTAVAFLLLSSDKDLDVFDLNEYCASEKVLMRLLPVVKASNKAIMSNCSLSLTSCDHLSMIISCPFTRLTLLNLSNNDLLDSGVEMLCSGLQNPACKLESLNLSGCLISAAGGISLASSLQTAPSLKELDLSYNHPGQTAMDMLNALLKDCHCSLESLRLQPAGHKWLTPGLRKYLCELALDLNTASSFLTLTDNLKVTQLGVTQIYPAHEDRFDFWPQIMCSESFDSLTGRCYWEVKWNGTEVFIAVSYRKIARKGDDEDIVFGFNSQSWVLRISRGMYTWLHCGSETKLNAPSRCSYSGRLAVYLDYDAGSLSFYDFSSNGLSHLHTFTSKFTEPLYPGFGLWDGSSVSLSVPKTN